MAASQGNIIAKKYTPFLIDSGIEKDGTPFSSRKWIDGEWVRFRRGKARTMPGYKQLLGTLPNIPRGVTMIPSSPYFNVYIGDSNSLKYFTIDQDANIINSLIDRTPTLFASNANNNWTFDSMFSTVSNSSIIIAHAAQDLASISSSIETPIYYGDTLGTGPLIPTGLNTSGGMVVLHPYLFIFSNDGDVSWTAANDPTTIINSNRATSLKIVAGARTRGGVFSPAGLLWSLDSLIRVTNAGATALDFNFDTISDEISILSKKSIIEYDGVYFWIGTNSWHLYDGACKTLPNNESLEFFFENVNKDQLQKIWTEKITRASEIWWHFCMKGSTECDHAIIFNIAENKFYNTPSFRSCGDSDNTFRYPIWAGNQTNGSGQYSVWQHEIGTDQNVNGILTPIRKFIKSCYISNLFVTADAKVNGIDRFYDLKDFIPDVLGIEDIHGNKKTGNINCVIEGREYPQSDPVFSPTFTFDNTTDIVDTDFEAKLLSFQFESNEVGGFFELGQLLLNLGIGAGR